ncbi:putative K(+)-stimulated pyrophosphate-energized sodium pump [Diplonema papillatum]|nr:putative K(+)-stimulated pyrophosphate-energized sodium pump [Diplonema papillatum]
MAEPLPTEEAKSPMTPQGEMELEKEEAVMPAWNEVPGRSAPTYTVLGVLMLLLSACAIVLCLFAEYTDDFDRSDKFHPEAVALTSRHWKNFVGQFEPIPEMNGINGQPLTLPERTSACIITTVAGGVPAGNIPVHYECTYEIPYAAVWAAMACSFAGFAAVCFYASSVLAQPRGTDEMSRLAEIIHDAAMTFLHQEYMWLAPFVALLWIFLYTAVDGEENDWVPSTSVSFLIGAFLSASCGYFGMHIATEGNCRTAAACYSDRDAGVSNGMGVAFRTGACMGLAVVSFGIFGLALCYVTFGNTNSLGGFGFGSSAVALFARVGGGIYTKAADVGADLCGKVDNALAEDSPKNPATIADCVGDNVGDVAGMGADLFESFVGAVVAACVMGAPEFGKKGVALPFYIVSIGLVWSIVCTVYVRVGVKADGSIPTLDDLLKALRLNIFAAGILITITTLFLCVFFFEDESDALDDVPNNPKNQLNPGPRLFGCIMLGLVVGILIGMVTEYFTSHTEEPTQSIGRATEFGPGPVIIQGLGMGMYSTVVPLLLIVAAVLGAYYLCGFYGTAITVCGMLSTLGVTMSTDAFGPVADNAGGIAEMSELPEWVRDYTDALDSLGNTTAATGKGFANGSAVLSAISLLAAFARVAGIEKVNLMRPVVVIGVLIGSLLPYIFGAMTMLSVNKAAQEMMHEVRRQFRADPLILTDPTHKPDYTRCITISCASSLREMLMPGVLAIFAPLIMGFGFGSHCLVGVLVGAIASGYLLGVQMSNTGGAWDNAKKWIEAGNFKVDGVVQGKKTDCHKAAVCGDTVGDPFKDTSGPALNILIKLMTRFSFVCAPLFDESWDFWWIGLILIGVAAVLMLVIQLVILKKPADESAEPVVETTEPVAEVVEQA